MINLYYKYTCVCECMNMCTCVCMHMYVSPISVCGHQCKTVTVLMHLCINKFVY